MNSTPVIIWSLCTVGKFVHIFMKDLTGNHKKSREVKQHLSIFSGFTPVFFGDENDILGGRKLKWTKQNGIFGNPFVFGSWWCQHYTKFLYIGLIKIPVWLPWNEKKGSVRVFIFNYSVKCFFYKCLNRISTVYIADKLDSLVPFKDKNWTGPFELIHC